MTQCTATSKRTGHRCGANAVTGKAVCYHHGGKSPSGIASATFKTGRYSDHLASRLLATYEESKRDPNLLALDNEIGLIDAHLVDLVKAIDTGESGAVWRKLGETHAAYKDASALGDIPAMKAHLDTMGRLIQRGLSEHAVWLDIRASLEQRRKLVESERKRLVEMHAMVTADQAALLVHALVRSVREHVHDPDVLAAIAADLGKVALSATD